MEAGLRFRLRFFRSVSDCVKPSAEGGATLALSQEESSMLLYTVKRLARITLGRTRFGAWWFWKRDHDVSTPDGSPEAPWWNAVLLSKGELGAATEQVTRLRLPIIEASSKNWDSLAALDLILKRTGRDARILDAGAETYSMILPWLAMYGYRNLRGCNLVFQKRTRLGPILYEYGDVTATPYPNTAFDAVTCLSVVEHGVNMEAYFREMARIVRPGGLLITSTDYYDTPVDTFGRSAYGVPIHVFAKAEMLDIFAIAERCGFELLSPIDLSCREKAVHWARHDLSYTYIIFSMIRRG